jgi:hypothetical protein
MPSSVIAGMYYNAAERTLTILYRGDRGIYRYKGVSPEEYAEFRAAPSKGTYLNQTFKTRQHPFERLPSSQGIHLVKKPPQKAESDDNGKDNRRSHR